MSMSVRELRPPPEPAATFSQKDQTRTSRYLATVSVGLLIGLLAGIAPGQTFTEFPLPTANSQPLYIAAGPDGNLWFTEGNGNKIARITTAGVITEFAVPTASSSLELIAAGPDGNLWFTEFNGNKIARITTAGVITEFPIPTVGSAPVGIAAGPDGNLWFTEIYGNKIGRVTTAGVITEFAVPTVSGPLGLIAAGPDGNLWFTETNGNKIGRITTAGVITEFAVPTAGGPYGIAAGPDGNLWFTEIYGNKIGRVTTGSGGGPPLTVSISGPSTGTTFAPLTFTAYPSGGTGPYTFGWTCDYHPGFPIYGGSGSTQTCIYTVPTTVAVVARVTDSVGAFADAGMVVTITALPAPSAEFTITGATRDPLSGNYTGTTGVPITFRAIETNAGSYAWDFGDGTSATGRTFTKVYSTPGTFSGRLTVAGDGIRTAGTAARGFGLTIQNPGCTADATTLCLNSSRFRVQVTWRVPSQGTSGVGTAVPLTSDTGYFWFFSSNNVELAVKVLDGRAFNQRFWVFYGALSDVEYTLTVTDTATGSVKSYFNPQGRLASVADTSAFAASSVVEPASSVATLQDSKSTVLEQLTGGGPGDRALMVSEVGRPSEGSAHFSSLEAAQIPVPCVQSLTTLCLNGSRFAVQVTWRVPSQGTAGVGTAVPLTSDTGYFWFFSSNNVELVIKVLDGRGFNGNFWVFYGALSDVEYAITVTDTATGSVRAYSNAQGSLTSRADTSAFTDTAVQITSLDKTSVPAFGALTIRGVGFDPNTAAISVLLIPVGTGLPIAVPVFSSTSTSLDVIIPPLTDFSTGAPSSGAVDVQVVQVIGSSLTSSNVVSGLTIEALPDAPSSVRPGAITRAYLISGLAVMETTKASPHAATVVPELNALAVDMTALISAVEHVMGTGQSVALPSTSGQPFVLDSATLAVMDKYVLGYLEQFLAQVQIPLTGSVSRLEADASTPCPSNTGDPRTDNEICSLQQYHQNRATVGSQAVQLGARIESGFYLTFLGGWATAGLAEAGAIGAGTARALSLLWSAATPYITAFASVSPMPPLSEPLLRVGARLLDTYTFSGIPVASSSLTAYSTYSKAARIATSVGTSPQGGLVVSSSSSNAPPGHHSVIVFQGSGSGATATRVQVPPVQATTPLPPPNQSDIFVGEFKGSTDDTVSHPPCSFRDEVIFGVTASVTGDGTLIDPFRGTFRANGSLAISVITNDPQGNCYDDIIAVPDLSGPVSGSSGKVEVHFQQLWGDYRVTVDFTNGVISGNTLTGNIRIDLGFGPPPIQCGAPRGPCILTLTRQ